MALITRHSRAARERIGNKQQRCKRGQTNENKRAHLTSSRKSAPGNRAPLTRLEIAADYSRL
ncbi:MAG TPA: hypothetical protein VK533_06545 [Sphingomonas sp.]|uniref:hypothetical protein n=1 Tax=Sphingomonas sp. TaxID=28214 RepID=UPI002CF57CF4|nr:hypothetical protein [Sphingomonas sp.]HMI19184.1 hypothetical protein [Sphingomonas sp.]